MLQNKLQRKKDVQLILNVKASLRTWPRGSGPAGGITAAVSPQPTSNPRPAGKCGSALPPRELRGSGRGVREEEKERAQRGAVGGERRPARSRAAPALRPYLPSCSAVRMVSQVIKAIGNEDETDGFHTYF